MLNECDASLERLGVDCIDLYQLHWPVSQPIEETAGRAKRSCGDGKIRAIGVSNFSVAQLEEWRSTGVPLHSLQAPYSILRPAVAGRATAVVRAEQRRRDRVLTVVPRHALRDVVAHADV